MFGFLSETDIQFLYIMAAALRLGFQFDQWRWGIYRVYYKEKGPRFRSATAVGDIISYTKPADFDLESS